MTRNSGVHFWGDFWGGPDPRILLLVTLQRCSVFYTYVVKLTTVGNTAILGACFSLKKAVAGKSQYGIIRLTVDANVHGQIWLRSFRCECLLVNYIR